MAKMANAGQHHRHLMLVARLDRVLVAHRSAGLDDRRHAGRGRLVNVVPEWEEGIGSHDRSAAALTGFAHRHVNRIDPAHLAGANTDDHAVFSEDDGIAFYVL